MHHSSYRFAHIIPIIFLFFLLSACQGGEGDEAKQPSFGTKSVSPEISGPSAAEISPLEILRCAPTGLVSNLSQFVIMFNQPMVALGDYDNVPPGALLIEPHTSGQPVWLNQYTLAFTLEAPLTGSAALSVTVPAGLKSLTGQILDKTETFTIELPQVAVLEARHLNEIRGASAETLRTQALKPTWQVVFNQPLALKTIKAFFVYEGASPIEALVHKSQNHYYAENTVFTFMPQKPLPPNTPYELYLKGGAKSLAGPLPAGDLPLAQGATFGPLTVTLEGSNHLNPAFGVYLRFSNPISPSALLGLIEIDNDYDFGPFWAINRQKLNPNDESYDLSAERFGEGENYQENPVSWQTRFYIPGGFKGLTAYTINLAPTLKDAYGQTLGEKTSLTFNTSAYTPFVRFDKGFGVLEGASPPIVPLTVSNLGEVTVQGYALDAELAVKLLHPDRVSPKYHFLDNPQTFEILQAASKIQSTIGVPPEAENGAVVLPLNLHDLFGEKLKGHLLYVRSDWEKN
ncbi:MAG: Ig-like domain-containing protein, partial [Candidatus Adiutrix sp.]